MNVEASFEANPKLAESGELGMRALDDPAMLSESLTAFHAATGDAGLDAALSQITSATSKVIALAACSDVCAADR
ncbi:hypothetical protein BGC_04900 [Burkholderia sp. 3C]